jgi:hypothetical protein
MTASRAIPTTDSVLAPLLIELHTDRVTDDLIDTAWLSATVSIPMTRPVLNVATGNNQTAAVKHLRLIARGTGGSSYSHIARLCDSRPDEASTDYWPRWRWEVGLRRVPKAAGSTTLVGPDRKALRFEVLNYRLTEGFILDAPQLALFRHYLIAGLRGIDPDLVVQGGQHNWQHSWWSDAEASGSR